MTPAERRAAAYAFALGRLVAKCRPHERLVSLELFEAEALRRQVDTADFYAIYTELAETGE